MVYYINKKILEKGGFKYKLSDLQDKFIQCYKNTNTVSHEDLMISLYGTDDIELSLNPMQKTKERLMKKCNIKIIANKKHYIINEKIKFMED